MDVKNSADDLKNKAGEVENLMRRKLPVIVGRMAKDHYQENFRKGGFQNRGLRKWPVTRRQSSGIAGAEGQYGPLLSRSNHLFGSIKYPVTFPCVLIGNVEADWNDIGMGTQMGVVKMSARLAIDCYDDTHYGSGTEDKVAERLQMANKLYTSLQCFRPLSDMGPMYRTKTRFYAMPGGIKVYEYIFEFEVNDDTACK